MATTTELDTVDQMLADRLATLAVITPPRLITAALSGTKPRRRYELRKRLRRGSIWGCVAVVVIAANAGAAYFAPSYGRALADAPVVGSVMGPALRAAGLGAGDVQRIYARGSLGRVTVTLVGGYVDSVQTTLFLDIEPGPHDNRSTPQPSSLPSPSTPFVTDQFGQTYRLIGGEGVGVGPYPSIFEPLRGAAARVGAELTVHVPVVVPRTGASVGEIDLGASLVPGLDGQKLRTPAPITAAGTTFAITGLELSSNAIEVHTTMKGALIDADIAASEPPAGGNGASRATVSAQGVIHQPFTNCVAYPGVVLVSASGAHEVPIAMPSQQGTFDRLFNGHVLDETRIFARTETGPFRVVVTGGGCQATPQTAPVLVSWTVNP